MYWEYDYCEHGAKYYYWYSDPDGKKYVYCTECKKIVWKQKGYNPPQS